MSDDNQLWYIKCGDLKGVVDAPSAEAAFTKLVEDFNGELALIFRAAKTSVHGKGRYYSTENALRSAGLWGGDELKQ